MDYSLTKSNVDQQLAAIRARVQAVTRDLDIEAFNWQPDGGRRWSIAQCLDHLVRTTELYARALDAAIDSAPAMPPGPPARPNLLGRGFIWVLEPPARLRVPTRAELMPPSHHVPEVLLPQFNGSLDRLAALAGRALTIDAGRARYANPLAGGSKALNVATGVMVMLAHNRRHLAQAEKVRESRARSRR